MKKYLIIVLSLFQYFSNAQSDDCIKSFSENKWQIQISLKLKENEMNKFKNEVQKLKWKYIQTDNILSQITLPDQKKLLSFFCGFPSFTQDQYTYFYPKTDFPHYLPANFNSKLANLNEDNSIDFELDEFKNTITYIEKNISSKIDRAKFEYYFADKREESYEPKEFRNSATIYNDNNEIVGRVHGFIGNHRVLTGHTDCNKIDYCRVTLYNSPNDKVYYVNLKNLKHNSILPIKEGKVFLSKRPIDLLRLEYCRLYMLMYNYATKYNTTISASLF
jgi:hypothetical protein